MNQKNNLKNKRKFNFVEHTILLLVVVIMSIASIQGAYAVVRTSTTAGGLWTAGTTWVGGVVPATGDDVYIATTGAGVVTLASNITILSLTINSGSELTTSTSLINITNLFLNNGTFSNTTGRITVAGGAFTNTGIFSKTGGRIKLYYDFVNTGTFNFSGEMRFLGANNQSIDGFTTTGLINMRKTGGIATLVGNVNGGSLNINRTGGTLNLGVGLNHTITGAVTRSAGTLEGGSSILHVNATSATAWNGTGAAFNPGTGTVDFGGGAQTIATTTFNNLSFSGTGTKTFTGVTVNAILSMQGDATVTVSSVPTYGANATLQYKGTASRITGLEFPDAFAGAGGLIIDQGAANTITLNANKTALTNINVQSGTLNLSTFTANRPSPGGALTVAGTLMLSGITGGQTGSNFPTNFTTLNMAGGTVNYNASTGGQTIFATPTYTNLTVDNSAGVALAAPTNISGVLTLTNGKITSTSTNLLTLTNTSATAIVGGSASSYIDGPIKWNLPAGLVSGSTYNFPVGSGTTYLPFSLVNPTTSGVASAQVAAVVGTSGGTTNVDATLASKSNTEYWSLATTGSFTNATVSLSRPTAIAPNNVIAGSTSITGTYSLLLGIAGTTGVSNSNLINTNRFFTFAREIKSITTGTITGSPFCEGATVSVPYTILGTFVSGNVFTAQLSDASGSFASPDTIGTLASTASGTISATIPLGTITGSGYRIRVSSSNPAITGTDNAANITVNTIPSTPATNGNFICIGTTSGTVLLASGATTGQVYKWYSASSAGTLLKTSTNNTDNTYTTPVIGATTSYWVSISNGSCESARTQVTATFPSASAADQALAATDSWIGHVYDGTNLNTYYGTTTQLETFDQSFLGSGTCFPFTAGADSLSIYTTTFSVRYRMNSTKKGLYQVNLGSDDGGRLFVDGNLVYNNWSDHGFSLKQNVLISLTGSSSLIYDFYENGGGNRVVFQNITPIIANTLTTNTTQNLIVGNTGAAISGDAYGTLPAGISLSGTGYQWTYSTTPGGARTNIAGATGATYTPNASITPFDVVGTYYIYRNAVLSSTNNVAPNPYVSSNESNAAILNVYDVPTIFTSTTSLNEFSYNVGAGPSVEQSFTVSGVLLTDNILISCSSNFEISTTSGAGFQTTPITLIQTAGSVAPTPIYVRLISGLPTGTYPSESVVLNSTGASTQTVSLSGLVNPLYCTSSGNMSYLTSITSVIFNTINNISAKPSGYSDYTSLQTTVYGGNTYNLSVNVNTDGNYTVYSTAQFDWNRNGDFTDVGETYSLGTALNTANGLTNLSPLSILVPMSAIQGVVRMRISAKFASSPTACETNFDGEVEDYNLNVMMPIIATGTIVGSPLTGGTSVSVPFTASAGIINGNVFTAQLSDANGSFASPVNIGTLVATTSGIINATIPLSSLVGTGYRIRVVSNSPAVTGTDNGVDLTINNGPFVAASPTSLSGFTYQYTAGPSPIQNLTVTGGNLSDNVIVTSSTSFEVSLTGGTSFSAQPFVTIPVSGGLVNQLVYVRMKAGLSIGTIAPENLIVSTVGVDSVLVACSGSITNQPSIIVSTTPVTNPVSISGFVATYQGTASAPLNFAISGVNLMGNVVLVAPTGYEMKTSAQSVYATTLTLTPSGATLAETTINVRLKSGLGVGSYTGSIVASSVYATSQVVTLSGDVNPVATITTSTSWLAGFIYSGTGPSASQSFQLLGTNLSANITVTPPADFELSPDGISWYTTAFTVTRTGNSVNQIMYARLRANKTANTSYGPENVQLSSTSAVVKTVALSGFVASTPTILVSQNSLNGFGYLFGNGPSVTQKVTISGAVLSQDITVVPPANFEILNPATGQFQTAAITLTRTGTTVNSTEVTIRLAAGLPATNYTGLVVASSTGASSKSVTLTGKVFASPLISSGGGGNYCVGETINLTSTGQDVQNQFWTGPNNYYSTLVNPTITNATPDMSGDYVVTGNVTVGGNLIVNGDFEMGNVGFSSSYGYATPAANALVPEGLYTVTNFGSDVHYNFNSVPDKNIIGAKQMVVNGNTTAGAVVWTQSVPVVPSSNYEFTYWLQTVVNGTDPAPSKLQLYVNGEIAGPVYIANPTSGIWTQYIYNTTSGTNNILNLELINQTTAANGNDFALDSIVFKQILSATSTQQVVVSPSVTASVSVTHLPANVYQGIPVVFTANPVNGGTTPTYKWFVDGVEQVGQTAQTFSYTAGATGTVNVSCQMTSSIQCAAPKPAIGSDAITIQTPPVNYWMGGIDTDWGKPGNWTANYIPATGDNVVYATVANYGTAAVRNLQLDQNRTIGSLINATIRSLIIPPALTLIVNNTVNVTPPVTIPETKAESLILVHASAILPNGSIIYHNPPNSPAFGTVEMYSPASWNLSNAINNRYNWQYFGIPLKALPVMPKFYGAYVRHLVESDPDTTSHWQYFNESAVLQPFIGYELCQQAPKFYTFSGELVNSNYNSGQLAKTVGALYPGQYVFANPYTSAIDIRQIEFGSDMERTVFMYHTGTFTAWGSFSSKLGLNPGNYVSSPQNQAGFLDIPRQVPSMGSMMMRILNTNQSSPNSYIALNYNAVAMGNTDRQRVKSLSAIDDQSKMLIQIESEHAADKMWLMSHELFTRGFDNGYDGKKLNSSALEQQIYAKEEDGDYQINSVNDFDNTNLVFEAGIDSAYKMIFTHENVNQRYSKLYLHDLLEDRIVDITDSGSSYEFNAASTPTPKTRFRILAQRNEATSIKTVHTHVYALDKKIYVQNFSAQSGRIYIYDISGRTVGIKNIEAYGNIYIPASNATVYIVQSVVGESVETTKLFLK